MDLLLNIDFDFFLNSQEDISQDENKALWISPNKLLEKINLKKIIQKECFLDHHESLFHWDKHNISNATCVHIDAHHDLYTMDISDWDIPYNYRGNYIGVGNYLFRAMYEGSISRVCWVIPDWLTKENARLDLIKNIGKGLSDKVKIINLDELDLKNKKIFLTISISPEWVPNFLDKEIRQFLINLKFEKNKIASLEKNLISRRGEKDYIENPLPYRFKFPYRIKE